MWKLLTPLFQRISEIIKRKNKQRLAKAKALAKKEAAGDFTHLKNKKGELIAQPLPQPTLPNVSLDDIDDTSSMRKGGPAPSMYTAQTDFYYPANKEYGMDYPPSDYPPMPAYGQQYGQYNSSVGVLPDDQQHYDDNDYGSTANLALAAAPMAGPDDPHAFSLRRAASAWQRSSTWTASLLARFIASILVRSWCPICRGDKGIRTRVE